MFSFSEYFVLFPNDICCSLQSFAAIAKNESFDEKFVTAKCSDINDGAMHLKVARYSFSGSIPPKFERKLRRHKQGFRKINTAVVLDKDENLL